MLDERFKKYLDEAYKGLYDETEEGATLPNFEIIDRTVEINTTSDPAKKIEQFARICYRSEDRITDTSANGLLDFCMKHDHGSIFEHFFISVFFPNEGNFAEVMGDEHLTPRRVWDACMCTTRNKHMFQYWDKWIQVNPSIPLAENMHWATTAGAVRAWRGILVPGIEASIKQDIYPALVLHLALLKKLNEFASALFHDIVEWVNVTLSNVSMLGGCKSLVKLTDGLDKEEISLDGIPDNRLDIGLVLHEAEGAYASFVLVTDRADSHQIVRHRVECGYSQESQRYCDYERKGVAMVTPQIEPAILAKMDEEAIQKLAVEIAKAMENAACSYNTLRYAGLIPESARAVLPNSCATKIGVSMSFVALEHFFNRRLAKDAQYSLRVTAAEMLKQLIDTQHPVMHNLSAHSLLRWCKWLIEQKCIVGGMEYWTDVITRTNEAIEQLKAERKRQAEQATAVEQQAEELRKEQLAKEAAEKKQ